MSPKDKQRQLLKNLASEYVTWENNTGFPFLQQSFCDHFAFAFGLYPIDLAHVSSWHKPAMETRQVMRDASIDLRRALTTAREFQEDVDSVYKAIIKIYNERLTIFERFIGDKL